METIAGSVLSACAVVSKVSAPAKVQHGAVGVAEVDMLAKVEGYTSMGTVLSACAVASEVLVLANMQLGLVVSETEMLVGSETEVVVACLAGDVHQEA